MRKSWMVKACWLLFGFGVLFFAAAVFSQPASAHETETHRIEIVLVDQTSASQPADAVSSHAHMHESVPVQGSASHIADSLDREAATSQTHSEGSSDMSVFYQIAEWVAKILVGAIAFACFLVIVLAPLSLIG